MKAAARRDLLGYAFILPWLIALVLFVGYPFISTMYFSVCDYAPLKHPTYIGMANYAELAADARFQQSLGITMLYAAVAIPLGVLAAMTLAVFLNARIRGQSFYRVIFYLPQLVPTVVVAILWMWIFNPQFGLLNLVLRKILWLADAWTGVFFNLDVAAIGGHFWYLWAGLLVIPVILAALSFGPLVTNDLRSWPRAHRAMRIASIVGLILVAVAALDAILTRFMPVDMAKLHSPGWLTDGSPMPSELSFAPSWALWALIVMSLWGVGQMAIIYLAKLQDVPEELYEAADIDGATWWHKARHITVPMISPVILFNVVLGIIGTFQIFAEPYIMTQGGPEGKTRFLAMFVYDQAFQYQRVGYASAVAWVLFLIIVAMTVATFGFSRKRVYYAGR